MVQIRLSDWPRAAAPQTNTFFYHFGKKYDKRCVKSIVSFIRFIFVVSVKIGVPSDDELEHLAKDIHIEDDSWKRLAGRLKFKTPEITVIDNGNIGLVQKAYKMLLLWKQANGSDATYEVLFDALTDELVNCRELAEKYCEN